MKANVDENGYFTGEYATVGGDDAWAEVETLPEETEWIKQSCYKLVDGAWIFDEQLYDSKKKQAEQDREEKQEKLFEERKKSLINQSKQNLADYLACHTVTSTCHGEAAKYSITSEKQSYLASMIMTTQMAQTAGIAYKPSWNASGQACTYDWTLEQLQQLAFEIESVVRPLVSKQQMMEMQLSAAETLEALEAVDITFGGTVDENA